MEFFLKQKAGYTPALKLGDIAEGEIVAKDGPRLYLDLGSRGTGIVFGREYYAAQDALKGLSVGDRVTAKVVALDNEEGYIELSLKEAGRERNWQELFRLKETGEHLSLKVIDANRGGLILAHLGVQGFLPASQLSSEHYPRVDGGDKLKIQEALKRFVGQEFSVAIMDVNPEEGKLIFSEKTHETEALRERLKAYHVGDVIEGEVAGVVSFGAFVRFGDGLEGLVHISEIDWQLIANPADVLTAGENVRAKIIGIEGEKVSLSLKALKIDPWATAEEKYKKGDLVTGTVVKLNPFGAFVKLDEAVQGLAHISEFVSEASMQQTLALNKPHEFRVLSVDAKEHRLALGLANEAQSSPSAETPAHPPVVAAESSAPVPEPEFPGS